METILSILSRDEMHALHTSFVQEIRGRHEVVTTKWYKIQEEKETLQEECRKIQTEREETM